MPKLLFRLLVSIPEVETIQVIVIDDCSPCANIMLRDFSELNRKNVEYHFLSENGGGGRARNEGLKYAKGKWILFADSDDFFEEKFVELLDDQFDNESDVVFFNIRSVNSDDVHIISQRMNSKETLFEKYRKTGRKEHFRYHYCEPWGKMIRKTLIEENDIRFDETRVANDYYFSVVCGSLAKNIDVVDRSLYVLTQRNDSVSACFANTDEKLLIRLDVYTRVQLFLQERGVFLDPMPIRGLMVILLKRNFFAFVKRVFFLHKAGISTHRLLKQMFDKKYFKNK